MTIEHVKSMLMERRIPFLIFDYDNEEEYLKHVHKYPELKYAQPCRVKVIVIECFNGYKNLEIQFNEEDGEFLFIELLFGEYCFDMYENQNEFTPNDLMYNIHQVLSEQLAIIVKNDIKRERWISDDCYVLNDDDPIFGEPAFFAAVGYINRPHRFYESLKSPRYQFEIYTANSYQCIKR